MNWLDIFFGILIALSVASGFARGFVRLGIGLLATIAGILLACWFYGVAGGALVPFVESRLVANVLGFGIVFAGVLLLGAALSWVLGKLLKLIGLSLVDRLGGALFGLVRGVLVCAVIVMAVMAFTKRPPQPVAESRMAPYLAGAAHTISGLAPYEIRDGVRKTYGDLQRMWQDVIKKPGKKVQARET